MKISLMNINVNACTVTKSLYIFSSHNASILIFQKMIHKYDDLKHLKQLEIWSSEQMRGPRKM